MTCDDNSFFDNPEFGQFQKLLFEGIQLAVQLVTVKQEIPPEPVALPEEPKLVRQLTKMKMVGRNSSIKVRKKEAD
jgi:hypothetical protein